jgi:hypothetical protein
MITLIHDPLTVTLSGVTLFIISIQSVEEDEDEAKI